MIKIGTTTINSIYRGENAIAKIYRGLQLLWPSSAQSVTSDLTFANNVGFTNNAQVFSCNFASGYGNTGLETIYSIQPGQGARIYWQYKASIGDGTIFGINTANAQAGYASMEWGVQMTAGTLNWHEAGTFVPADVTITDNQWVGILMCEGLAQLQISNDGITWTNVHKHFGYYRQIRSGHLYVVCDLLSPGGKMYTPKIDLYGTGTVAKLFIQQGNSLALGYLNGTYGTDIGLKVWESLDSAGDYIHNNFGVLGGNLQANTIQFNDVVLPLLTDKFSEILISECEAVNTLSVTTGALTFALMQNYINTVLAADPRIKLLVYMCPSANSGSISNAERVIYNNLLGGVTETSRLKIVDIRDTPELNDALAWQSPVYYQLDGVHGKQPLYDLLGTLGIAKAATF